MIECGDDTVRQTERGITDQLQDIEGCGDVKVHRERE